jgi:hypothetical protein
MSTMPVTTLIVAMGTIWPVATIICPHVATVTFSSSALRAAVRGLLYRFLSFVPYSIPS